MKRFLILLMVFILLFTFSSCNQKVSMSKDEAYNIYYDTITKFVPELMTEPQECDIEIKTRDEVTFITEHFIRKTTTKIKSQNVDGKLQYYLLNDFPEANKRTFYCIDDNKFYHANSSLNSKGKLQEWNYELVPSLLLDYHNAPQFTADAIKSFTAKKTGFDIKITFVVDGTNMQKGYAARIMKEILPNATQDKLDDVKIVLTIGKDGSPKNMSTEISMRIPNDDGSIKAEKSLNLDFIFNKLDNVDFDLKEVISKYTSND